MEEKKQLKKEKEEKHSLKALYDTDGGKLLVDTYIKDIRNVLNHISVQYKTMSLIEFVSKGAELNSKLNVVLALTKAKKNEELLDNMLKGHE